jgi:chromate transporter
MSEDKTQHSITELTLLFLRLGLTAFGGPAAHIALFHDEVVKRRQWLTDEEFLDLLGITNLIPGPNSTEMAIHIGLKRAGWRGLLAAGIAFILPAMLLVLLLAWLYVQYGTTPAVGSLLYGIKPVMVAVILQALWGLAPKAAKTRTLAAIGIATFVLYLLGINELVLLFGAGIVLLLIHNIKRLKPLIPLLLIGIHDSVSAQDNLNNEVVVSLSQLFLIFLKIGAVLYGSGYVLLAFLRGDFVQNLGWLTEQQLLDAVAIGQFTPGPVFTTATFIGYLLAGLPGAVLATIGIFLPSFVFVAGIHRILPFLRRAAWFNILLEGVNAASLGLMAGVTVQLGRAAVTDWLTGLIGVIAAILLLRYKVNSTWLILGGGVVGLLYALLTGTLVF